MEYTKGEQCSARVYDSSGFGASYQCQKKAVVERDGKHYCKIHDPEYIATKKLKWQENFDREWAEKEKRGDRNYAINLATQGLTTSELNTLSPNLLKAAPDLYEALKQIVNWMEKWQDAEWNFNGMLVDGRKAITKAER